MKPASGKILAAMMCILAVSGMAFPASAEETATGAVNDVKAKELLQTVAAFYGAVNTVTVESTLTIKDVGNPDETRQMTNTFSVSMRRPKQVAVAAKGDAINFTAVSDGEKLYVYNPKNNEYQVRPAPDSPASVLGGTVSGIARVGVMMMAEPLRSVPYAGLTDGITEQHYLGEEDLNGRSCHHARYIHEKVDWDMWVDAGEKPLISKITVDLTKVLGKTSGPPMKIDMAILYKDWVVNGEFSDNTFTFAVPEGAKLVDPNKPTPTGKALVGKEAPAFTLDLLGGGKLDLAEHKGKHVVILDFWASWCGPCRKAMPVYAKIAEEYKEKGVAFYAVNLAESAETARGFLEKVGVQCAVALDADGNVGKKYGAASIPMSVIIGKDGIVTNVHAGFSDALAAQLKQELDALLKGGEPSGAEALRAPSAPATAP